MSGKPVIGMVAAGTAIFALGAGLLIAISSPRVSTALDTGQVQVSAPKLAVSSPVPMATPDLVTYPVSPQAGGEATSAGVWSTPAEFAPPD